MPPGGGPPGHNSAGVCPPLAGVPLDEGERIAEVAEHVLTSPPVPRQAVADGDDDHTEIEHGLRCRP